ncbi:DUF881 domain-containing protein [Bifidobacterium amazonense]|uniref:DUF881 domain-containing protein n=1 Tax=Bifidobacterium amazonense TaxID=2809027 RepID=A0ABS9VYI3_9BIFI|nr:DUF881 domain-containing protein [Bifidobacterium amazonense]MCH9277180.1 DUF881 domain-containing protein [Bifidobacterium amazonense]
MARHSVGKHGVRRPWFSRVAALLVIALTGFLLATNVRVNRTTVISSDTADLIEQRQKHVTELNDDVKRLSAKIDTLRDLTTDGTDAANGDINSAGSGTTLRAIHGPGITVTLDDSPLWENMVDNNGSASNINDYVVHQEDIESVMNALWAGGAEAMMIQDQRVLFNSAVICQGNVLLLQGRKYSPPYKVSAIGPVDGMTRALGDSQAVQIYKQYVSAFGLGWKVESKDNLEFPEAVASLQSLQYSSVIGSDAESKGDSQDTSGGSDTGGQ